MRLPRSVSMSSLLGDTHTFYMGDPVKNGGFRPGQERRVLSRDAAAKRAIDLPPGRHQLLGIALAKLSIIRNHPA